jgi:hypothetical protein
MYQAILTKFLGPTNTRGSRVRASAEAGSVTIECDDRIGMEKNHIAAARALALKYGWAAKYYGGGMPQTSGHAYAFVCSDRADLPSFEITAKDLAA